MTREEAKAFLENAFPVLSAKMQLAIKTLKEEPFMNKKRCTKIRCYFLHCAGCTKSGIGILHVVQSAEFLNE